MAEIVIGVPGPCRERTELIEAGCGSDEPANHGGGAAMSLTAKTVRIYIRDDGA